MLALKVMHPALAADTAFVERFIREAKSVARLDHPNVVGVFDQGSRRHARLPRDGVRRPAARCATCCASAGALSPRAALDILEPVLAALGAAHRAGLVHRDMKPENVLIGDDGRVKVADFGLVRAVGADTTASTGSLLGTVSYLAPEQIEAGVADHAHRRLRVRCRAVRDADRRASRTRRIARGRCSTSTSTRTWRPPRRSSTGARPAAGRAGGRRHRPRSAVPSGGRRGDCWPLLRTVRAALSEAQLDAVPAAGPLDGDGGSDGDDGGEGTTVLRRDGTPAAVGDDTMALHRTSRFQLPPDLVRSEGIPTDRRRRPSGWFASRRGLVALVAALAVLLGGGTVVWYVAEGQFTDVPAVLAVTQGQAEHRLHAAGLGVHVSQAFSETVAKGHVISTDPGPGGRIRGNGVVDVVVSRGPQRIEVPAVAGRSLAAARKRISAAGLTPGTVTRVFSDSVPAGAVVSTDPAQGSAELLRQRGGPHRQPRPARCRCPTWSAATLSDAEQALQAAGSEGGRRRHAGLLRRRAARTRWPGSRRPRTAGRRAATR